MRRTSGVAASLAALASIFTTSAAAQSAPDSAPAPPSGAWATLALGGGSEGLSGLASLSIRTRSHGFILRATGMSEFTILSPPETVVEDYALLYSQRTGGKWAWLRGAIGPAWVEVERRGQSYNCAWFFCDYERHRTSTLGLALQGDLVLAPLSFLGVNITGAANLNPEQSFAMAVLGLNLGKMR